MKSIIVIICGLFSLSIGSGLILYYNKIILTGIKTNGIVVDKREYKNINGDMVVLKIKYSANGVNFVKESSCNDDCLDIQSGDAISLYYLPTDPNVFLSDKQSTVGIGLAFFIPGIIVIIIGFYLKSHPQIWDSIGSEVS